jgi:two-component system OmpR family response regulator
VVQASRSARVQVRERALTNRYILVVDDDVDALQIFHAVIAYHGSLVRTVPTARHALRLLRYMRPDVIVSDISMPNESGLWLVRRLRERGETIPMIAVTGYDTTTETLLEAGFDAAFTKPVDHGRLIQTLRDLAGGIRASRDRRRVLPFRPVSRRSSARRG